MNIMRNGLVTRTGSKYSAKHRKRACQVLMNIMRNVLVTRTGSNKYSAKHRKHAGVEACQVLMNEKRARHAHGVKYSAKKQRKKACQVLLNIMMARHAHGVKIQCKTPQKARQVLMNISQAHSISSSLSGGTSRMHV